MERKQPVGDLTCAYCDNPGGTYSLACLGCVRRLWKNSLPANRDGILSMVEAFGSLEIADRIRKGTATTTTKKRGGSGSTSCDGLA